MIEQCFLSGGQCHHNLQVTSLFSVKPKSVPTKYRKVVNFSQKAPYFSVSPIGANAHVEDKALIRFCREKDLLADAENCWLSVLGCQGKLLLSHPTVYGGTWFLSSRATSGAACLLGLPAQSEIIKGKTFYTVDQQLNQLHWLPILDPLQWKCFTVRWRSPWSIRLSTGEWPPNLGCMLEATATESNLQHVAALNGFWKLPKTVLLRIGRHFGAVVSAQDSLAKILLSVAESALGRPLSEQEQLNILRLRMPKHSDAKEFLESEECHDLMDKSDRKVVEDRMKEEESTADAMNDIRAKAKALAKKLAEKKPRRGGGAATSSRGPAPKKQRKYPPTIKMGVAMTTEDLNQYVPTGCRFGIDRLDKSWRLSAYGERWSRAWHLYGYENAAYLLIQMAWQTALDEGHEQECPFADLLRR